MKPHIEQQVRQAADEGLSLTQAAKSLGLARITVRQYARRMGVEFKDGRKNKSDLYSRLVAAAAEGMTASQAARKLGIPHVTVDYYRVHHGVSFVRTEQHRTKTTIQLNDLGKTPEQLIQEYGSIRKLAQAIGIHYNTVLRWFRKHGYPRP